MFDQDNPYFHQVALLVAVLPLVGEETCFALKGGTAINLFVQDLPRLSVDIDLTYLPIEERQVSLTNITLALQRIGTRIKTTLRGATVDVLKDKQGNVLKLLVARHGVRVKIEVSPVLRGSLLAPVVMDIAKPIEQQFSYTRMRVLHFNELYAGKLCAALDRQHPRDLFDVKILLDADGISDALINLFVVYLVSGNRPVAELLDPRPIPLTAVFNEQFAGMELTAVTLPELEETQQRLPVMIKNKLTEQQKQFLLSFKNRLPDWSLLGIGNVENFPAMQWKLHNLSQMPKQKHQAALTKLEKILYG